MTSLYEKIGGEKAVEAAVDIFYSKVINDHALSHFFDGISIERQKRMQKSFLTVAFGGPNNYSGRGMRAAHARPVALGLNESHFNKVAEHLQKTLLELNVPYDLIQEAMNIAASTKADVLNL
ncbi:group 1 truncated hemoglobin [Oceaniserpentilla sp. 4NH20-0058]|uniref:group I truncated hemoglobin n=1 Tax=Oceaniserpentilla sp. 4NH20-0058 TaxID=3127660 RepID=UPI003103EAF1